MTPNQQRAMFGLVVLFLILMTTSTVAQDAKNPVVWKDSKLSVQFEKASISEVLNAIAKAAGFKLTIDPAVAGYRESVSFKTLPLREGVLKVLEGSGMDYILVGDPHSPQTVSHLILLGFSPKASPGSGSTFAASDQGTPVTFGNPVVTPNPFSDRRVGEAGTPPPPAGRGSFLPFPEAGGTSPEIVNESIRRPIPPNPFSPNGSSTPTTETTGRPKPPRRGPGFEQ